MDNVRVPSKNMVGVEGQGFKIAMKGLDGGRINIGSCSLGGAYASLKAAKVLSPHLSTSALIYQEYVSVRKQFGATLDSNQTIQFKLAEMATNLHASRLLVRLILLWTLFSCKIRSAAQLLDDNDPNGTIAAAMGKKYATDNCFNVL